MLSIPVTTIPIKTEHLSIKMKFFRSRSLVPSVVPGKEWVLHDYTPTDSMNEGVQVTAVFYLATFNEKLSIYSRARQTFSVKGQSKHSRLCGPYGLCCNNWMLLL